MPTVYSALDYTATALLALAASCRATQYGSPLAGAVTLGCAAGLVSPLMRDALLGMGRMPALHDVCYVAAAFLGALAGRALAHWSATKVFMAADALSLGLATAMGAAMGVLYGLPPAGAVVLGVLAGTAASVLRDVCLGDTPFVLDAEFYALASAIGAMLVMALAHVRVDSAYQVAACTACVLVLRWIGHKRASAHGMPK